MHTKGKMNYTETVGSSSPATLYIENPDDGEVDIATFDVWDNDNSEEMIANARRICLAVNNFDGLLDGCRKALSIMQDDTGWVSSRGLSVRKAKAFLEQALAKAEKGE